MNNIYNSDNPLDEFRFYNKQELIAKLNSQIIACNKCENDFRRKCYHGNTYGKVLVINDSATDDIEVLKYYYDILNISELKTEEIFHVNAVSCITTRQNKDGVIQRIPSKKECNNCKDYLNKIIDIIKPKIIVSLGATSLNQFMPNSNLLDYIDTTQYFNGIPTLINYSIKDLFNLCEYKSDSEIDEISSSILDTFNEASRYINL